jgi:hypothetical protein
MVIDKQIENGRIIQKIFEILLDVPSGLPIKDIMARLPPPQGFSSNGNRFFERVMTSCIPPIKAGWLISRGYYLSVSESGKLAFQQYPDPAELLKQAAMRSRKGWLSFRYPRTYYFAGKAKDQVIAELRAARRIGARQLAGRLIGTQPSWKKVLPLQSLRRIVLPSSNIATFEELVQYLKKNKLQYHEGGHAIYLPPESLKESAFSTLAAAYPINVGLKIVKERGGVDEASYVATVSKGDSRLHLGAVHTHKHLTLVANLLYAEGLGPRLFDLVEIEWGEHVWTAYVIEDIGGGTPTMEQCEEGVNQLRRLQDLKLLRLVLPEGFEDAEFKCPGCENNALVTADGSFKYIDFQNFLLNDYGSYLKDIALEATEASHFGDKSVLRGGRYLYQTVPGVNLPAKRGIDNRIKVLSKLFQQADVSLNDRVVFDVGCNIGMMMGQYLRLGARWTHGWDRPYVTPHTEKLLLALGCTRFSTSPADITASYDLLGDIPSFLAPALAGCVVSYLAVRGHIGWLKALDNIPWSFLIYEGHEGETRQDFERFIEEFKKTNEFMVAAVQEYEDGDSDTRTLAILRRRS